MTDSPKVRLAAVSGSLRTAALNRRLLALAVKAAEAAGAEVDVIDLKTLVLPIYDGDVEVAGFPAPAVELKERLGRARGLIVATPEYNHSIPGGLKNALDWASRPPQNPFRGKPVAVIGATSGAFGTVRAQTALRSVLGDLGMWVVPPAINLPFADEAFSSDGGALADPRLQAQLEKVVQELVRMARRLAG